MPKYFGNDYLGGAKYGKAIIEAHPKGFAAGFFTNVDGFGDSLPVVSRLLDTGRCPCIRLHLCWDDNHQYADKFERIRKEAKRVAPLIKKYPHIAWYISGACEHLLNKAQAEKLANLVLAELPPGVIYVNTGHAMIDVAENKINEVHLDDNGALKAPKGRYNFSYDGQPCTDFRPLNCQQIKDRFANSEIFFFWDARFNGNWEWGIKVPRPQRKGWADARFITSVSFLGSDMGKCKLQKNTLGKSHSENKGTGDPRAEKPVFITPVAAKELSLFAAGVKVATLPYYAPYLNNTRRYYAKDWGFQIAMKAMKLSGSGLCEVRANKKVIGYWNPAFRFGEL